MNTLRLWNLYLTGNIIAVAWEMDHLAEQVKHRNYLSISSIGVATDEGKILMMIFVLYQSR